MAIAATLTHQRSNLSRQQAALVIRHYAGEAYDEHGADDEQAVDELRRRLSWLVGGDLSAIDTAQYMETLAELDALERGTHPDLDRNRARTVDNTAELRDAIEQELTAVLNQMLDGARITGAYVRLDGTKLTTPTTVKAA